MVARVQAKMVPVVPTCRAVTEDRTAANCRWTQSASQGRHRIDRYHDIVSAWIGTSVGCQGVYIRYCNWATVELTNTSAGSPLPDVGPTGVIPVTVARVHAKVVPVVPLVGV